MTDLRPSAAPRRRRADAQRNVDALIAAARTVLVERGVDAPAKEISDLAGVGVGTLYRHFPRRSDLIKAVFRREVDACADAAPGLAAAHPPLEALTLWLARFGQFIAAKRGLAAALHSGDPAFDELPGYFDERFDPALGSLLADARAVGELGDDITPSELLSAVADLSLPSPHQAPGFNERMIALLLDGLRFRAAVSQAASAD